MEAPRAEIGEVVSEPPAEPLPCGAEQVGGDAVPALWGSGIGALAPVPAECAPAQTCGAKLGGNAKILDGVDFSKVCDADKNPQYDQCTDYQTPYPASGM